MSAHKVHAQIEMSELFTTRWKAGSLSELRSRLIERFGPFPLLFGVPAFEAGVAPAVVFTSIRDETGRDREGEPFRCGTMMGYMPVRGADGSWVASLGSPVKTPAYDDWIAVIQATPDATVPQAFIHNSAER